jgi:hypothetical protein
MSTLRDPEPSPKRLGVYLGGELVAFSNEQVDHHVDGELLDRPKTKLS